MNKNNLVEGNQQFIKYGGLLKDLETTIENVVEMHEEEWSPKCSSITTATLLFADYIIEGKIVNEYSFQVFEDMSKIIEKDYPADYENYNFIFNIVKGKINVIRKIKEKNENK